MQELIGRLRRGLAVALLLGAVAPASAAADQLLTADEAIIQNSLCVGNTCAGDELFLFDTVRLHENNLRIHFNDSSNPAGDRASTDWRIVANDSEAGGADYFDFQDAGDDGDQADSLLRLAAGAPNNSMMLNSAGHLGLGTGDPQRDLHIINGDTPVIRLGQTGGTFDPYTWDIGGNEANFFIRDESRAAGTSRPFVVRSGAPTASIEVESNGDVGIGENDPEAQLDVRGDARTDGTIAQLSDAASKNSVAPVDPADILAKVNALAISTWKYNDDPSGQTHLGPMAQDFFNRFGVGQEQYVSLQDLAGVSLAADQALSDQVDSLGGRVGGLDERVGGIDERVGALEGAPPGAPDLTDRVAELESGLATQTRLVQKLKRKVRKLAKTKKG